MGALTAVVNAALDGFVCRNQPAAHKEVFPTQSAAKRQEKEVQRGFKRASIAHGPEVYRAAVRTAWEDHT